MQTNALNIQLNANAPAPSQRNGAAANSDAAQFGAMLSNEMEMRQPAPAPAPAAPKAEAPKPQAADKPAQPDDAAPQQAARPDDAAKPAATGKADDAQDADKADSDKDSADEQSGEAADPASAMLALMASLQKPAEDTKTEAAAGAASQAFDALNGAGGKGKRGETAQLAALQAAMKSVSKDGSGIATSAGKAFSDTAALRNPALAATGAGIAADDKLGAATDAGAKLGADLRAAFAATPGQGQLETQLDTAALALQQARESAAAREPAAAVSALAPAQPAVLEAVQAAAAAADELSARVGTEAWENQVGQKVVYMVGNDEQTASLTLNPPDLGPLQVVLSVTNDQASVTFSANQEEVRQALEDALPRLREMMSESGIALNNASVNAGMPDNRQAQEQAARNNGGFGGGNRGRGDNGNTVEEAPRAVTRTATLGDRGMVDTFA
jgi:flagellar hook-length control protein FliK